MSSHAIFEATSHGLTWGGFQYFSKSYIPLAGNDTLQRDCN